MVVQRGVRGVASKAPGLLVQSADRVQPLLVAKFGAGRAAFGTPMVSS